MPKTNTHKPEKMIINASAVQQRLTSSTSKSNILRISPFSYYISALCLVHHQPLEIDRFEHEKRVQRALMAHRVDPDHDISKAAVDEGISTVTLWDLLRLQQRLRPINYEELRV